MSPLIVTPDDPDPFGAALASDADPLVLDLGDADAPGDRAVRRAWAAEVLGTHAGTRGRGGVAVAVRVAPLGSGLADADLDAVMAGAPDAVWLAGAVGARDLQHLAAKLAVREAEHGLPAGRTRVIAAPADTPAGVLALPSLPGASPRLLALAWDGSALAARLGLGAEASPVRHARDLLLIAAAAAGVPAIDLGRAFCNRRHPAVGESVSIGPFIPDHPGFRALRDEAAREGFALLDRLAEDWASGANRFDRPGECLLCACAGGTLVGVGGLNRDPYVDAASTRAAPVGRLRHLYVSPAARRRGLGTALVARLLAAAGPAFARVRLRTDTASAAAFYEARGFEAVEAVGDSSATHSIATRGAPPP